MTAKPTSQQRYRGCLLAGAAGDALGAAIEFWSLNDIRQHFGSTGVSEFIPAYGRLGAITDDTQMTLFSADGLLRGLIRYRLRGEANIAAIVDRAYQRWLLTQGSTNHHLPSPLDDDSTEWLYQHEALHHCRAPGMTCLSALRAKTAYGDKAENGSKGCGGVMRVAPVGLYGAHRLPQAENKREVFRLGCAVGGLTHGHPTGQVASGALAVIISELVRGATLPGAITDSMELARTDPRSEETVNAMSTAMALADTEPNADAAIQTLGDGWIAEEALAIALYACLRASTLEQAVIEAANHGGDSDSTAAIAGHIAGAFFGSDALPNHWLEHLELRGLITEVADDLFECIDWKLGPEGEDTEFGARGILAKYPAC